MRFVCLYFEGGFLSLSLYLSACVCMVVFLCCLERVSPPLGLCVCVCF